MNYIAWFQDVQNGFFSFNRALNFFVKINLTKEEINELNCPNDIPFILSYKADLEKDGIFNPDFDGDIKNGWFGFNRFFRVEIQEQKALLCAEIPRTYFQPEETCPTCNGEGFKNNSICIDCNGNGKMKKNCSQCQGIGVYTLSDGSFDYKCLMCNGTGLERPGTDWSLSNFTIANISLLFRFLNAKCDDNQVLKPIVLFQNNPAYSVSVGARLNMPIEKWIYLLIDKNCSVVRQRMLNTHSLICCNDDEQTRDWYIKAEIKPLEGSFYLECPGDRCCIHGSGYDYNIGDHNVDNPMQVLVLLAGLLEMNKLIGGQKDGCNR